jgi:hypothetical protein
MASPDEQAFADLQRRLRPVEATDNPRDSQACTILAIPSMNFDPELLAAHAAELPAMEERCLYFIFALRRPRVRLVVVTSLPVDAAIVDYYLRLIPGAEDPRARLELLSPEDDSPRPLARKLLERPDLIDRLRALGQAGERPFIMPFNVRDDERDLALALDVPIYGIDHRFARYGLKSGGRRLFMRSGVPHPLGENRLSGTAELGDALMALRDARPGLEAAVIKLDDAVYGEGNRIFMLRDLPPPGTAEEEAAIDVRLRTMPFDYLERLSGGGVVEELIGGEIRSPSVQMRVLPGGRPVVLATHDQVLGGEIGQTFVACRFPASPEYAGLIAQAAFRVGEQLASEGVIGRFGVDFVVGRVDGGWEPYAVEINLREGGTSHPYGALWLLTDGSLQPDGATYLTPSGRVKHYFATDRLCGPDYANVPLAAFLQASATAGIDWDPATQTGAIHFMLRSLAEEGRIATVAIGDSQAQANAIYLAVARMLDRLAS